VESRPVLSIKEEEVVMSHTPLSIAWLQWTQPASISSPSETSLLAMVQNQSAINAHQINKTELAVN